MGEKEKPTNTCIPILLTGEAMEDAVCIGEGCKCCWDASNQDCLIRECLYAYFTKANWELIIDMTSKKDEKGRRVLRTEEDMTALKEARDKVIAIISGKGA